jgi:hypothetical protein
MKAALAIERGNAEEGVEILQRCQDQVYPATYELHTELHMRLVEGFTAMG